MNGAQFVGVFLAGAVVGIIAMTPIWVRRYKELTHRWKYERERRIEAEMTRQVVNIQPWGLDELEAAKQRHPSSGNLIDLTNLDLPPGPHE